ncbi:MAG: glycosyltransferase family 4 protein [Cyclobacteriaceae bacterium]|nr:glycosyltransferase family 4 protein [Cyclobacteriaceae bacterium]
MRIGIDAKWYFEGPPSGRRVVRALVEAMLRCDQRNEYYIFLNQRHRAEQFPMQGPNIHLVYVWAGNNQLSNVFVLPRYANRYKVDVTLYQNFISPFGTTKKIAYIHDVLFLSNPEFYTTYERLYFAPLKYLTRRADAVITVSEEERKRLIHFGFAKDPDKLFVAHHGVDSTFLPRNDYDTKRVEAVKLRYALPDRFLLFVGRLNLRKNVDNLLKGVALLQDKDIPLVIVGTTNWKESNHLQTIKALGIEDRVQFKGSIDQDLGVVYSLSTLFCFPSFAESFGLPPLEAMACGVPVVVSDTTSLPEICGDAGNYVPADNPQQIAAVIDSLLCNGQLYESKKMLGLAQARKFTWENAAKKILQVMETVNQSAA